MKQKLKVYDYATTMRISVPTVYRRIKAGKLGKIKHLGEKFHRIPLKCLRQLCHHLRRLQTKNAPYLCFFKPLRLIHRLRFASVVEYR